MRFLYLQDQLRIFSSLVKEESTNGHSKILENFLCLRNGPCLNLPLKKIENDEVLV
jgi:hypothetical protein